MEIINVHELIDFWTEFCTDCRLEGMMVTIGHYNTALILYSSIYSSDQWEPSFISACTSCNSSVISDLSNSAHALMLNGAQK